MSSSTVTYTSISFDSDLPPWGFHLMDPSEFEAPEEAPQSPEKGPPSLDYVPGPEHPPSPDYVPGPEYPEYVAPSDQPLHADASPTVLSPGYVADFVPSEEDPEEDPKADPADYLADGGDDEEEEESSEDDDDDEEEEEASEEDEDEEEKEHLAPTYFATATPPPPPQTIVPVSMTRHHRARISVRPHTPLSPSIEAFIAEYASTPTPPSPPLSPLSPLSSPLPRIPSPPPHTSPTYASAPLRYIAAMIQLRVASPLHVPSSPLHVPSPPLFEVGESSTAVDAGQTGHTLACRVDYGFIDTVDASIQASERRTGRPRFDESSDLLTEERERGDTFALWLLLMSERLFMPDRHGPIQRIEARLWWLLLGHRRLKMPPKRTTTPMFGAAIKALVAQSVADALAEHEANRNSRNGDDSTNQEVAKLLWNSYVKTVGHDAAYGMPWKTLKKMMTAKYCLRSEIKKLEIEIWNLKVKGSVMASKPKIMQDAIEFATELMDQKIRTFADRQAKNKRKLDD
ncbi:hypothetical protein Tco_1364800, partial [Tanacetum coccineum]